MTVSIDKYGEINMKLSEWAEISEWLKDKPELHNLSVNEVIKTYIERMNKK